ncbi:MAG: hypothetical protein IMZ66_06615, partial [Planctomycetes bacterium]|nr:hypothetical protein [Planctomycetota bacterium]
LKRYVDAKLFLEGKPARSLSRTPEYAIVTAPSGRTLEVPNVVLSLLDRTTRTTEAKFADAFRAIAKDAGIAAISASTQMHPHLFRVAREDYPDFVSAEPPIEQLEQQRTATLRATLGIITVSFDPTIKWRLVTQDATRIAATMRDPAFLAQMKSREDLFADGDSLDATLRFNQSRPAPDKPWQDVAGTHEVITVHKHIPLSKLF